MESGEGTIVSVMGALSIPPALLAGITSALCNSLRDVHYIRQHYLRMTDIKM